MTEKKTAVDYRDEAQSGQMQVNQAVNQLALDGAAQHKASGYTQERDLVNQLLARAQFAKGLADVVTVTSLQDLKRIKEEKLYQSLSGSPVTLANGQVVTVTTWEGFCRMLGFSREHIDEQLRTITAIGAKALDSMKRIGLGYRDLRKLRKLPDDEQQVIVGEVEANVGDKEALLALIDELAAKHVKEKDGLEKRLATQERRLEQKQKDVDGRDEQIADLQGQLKENQAKTLSPEEAELAYLLRLGQHEERVMAIASDLSPQALQDATPHCRLKAAHMAEFLEVYGRTVRDELMLSFPELWDPGAIPNSNLVHADQEALKQAFEKLEDGLPVKTEDLS